MQHHLVDQVVRFAFLLRLLALAMVVFVPADVATPLGLTAVGFIMVSSALGLYRTEAFTSRVASHPILLVADVLIASLIASVFGSHSPIILYSVSTAVLIGMLLRPWTAGIVLGILVASHVLVVLVETAQVDPVARLLLPITYVILGAMGILVRALHQSAMSEQATARRLSEDAARERERARLAREMHDSVAKSLHGISLAAASLPAWAERDPATLTVRAREIHDAAESASRDARAILVALRTDTDDRTLVQQLRALVEGLAAAGLRTELEVRGIGDCDHTIKRELVSIAAEAVENVQRHSAATTVVIDCLGEPDTVTLRVRDDGVGFRPDQTPAGHFGLLGMRERAEGIGAAFAIDTAPGAGTQITVRAPRALPEGDR